MAEPEDVEEDLFADLYDADDTTAQSTSVVEPPQVSDPITSAPPVPATEPHTQYADQHHGDAEVGGSYQYSHQSGNHVGGENGGAGFPNLSATPVGDSEPQGTGIKEDGHPEGICQCLNVATARASYFKRDMSDSYTLLIGLPFSPNNGSCSMSIEFRFPGAVYERVRFYHLSQGFLLFWVDRGFWMEKRSRP